MNLSFFKNIFSRTALSVIFLLLTAVVVHALPLTHYASSSRLASGRWRKIEVKETGMQFVSNAQLKAMGFTDPSKVNIYGYGGRKVSDNLSTADYVDDLPVQPVVRTSEGLVFFGVNTVSWKLYSDRRTPYQQLQNPFSSHSYYFVSDCELTQAPAIPELNWSPDSSVSNRTTTFIERVFHEKDLFAPSVSGNWFLGEDFTMQPSHEFKFKLPGIADTVANIMVGFGTLTSDSTSYDISINGQQLPRSLTQRIGARDGDKCFLRYRLSISSFPNPTEDLTVGIKYNPTGMVSMARLGFINICYQRKLQIPESGQLMFYRDSYYNLPCVYEISGVTETTQIWDITNPASPARISFTRQGDKALFSPGVTSYREFIAFDAAKVKIAPTSEGGFLSNQDIHSTSTPDMVIITPREYLSHARQIGEMHDRLDNFDVFIVTPEVLYNEFSSGVPDIAAMRKALKMWYDRDPNKLKYCLLLGRPTYDQREITDKVRQAGYPHLFTWQVGGEDQASTIDGLTPYATEESSYSTDDYFAMLSDNYVNSNFQITRSPYSIAVGRLPFRGTTHATQMTNKLLKYIEQPVPGKWRNQITMIADNGNSFAHFDQTNASHQTMLANGGANFLYEKILLSLEKPVLTSSGNEYPSSRQRMLQMIDQGTSLVWYIGHANPREWTHEKLFTYTDMCEMKNRYLPFFVTATCEYTRWDDDQISGGEIVWSHPEAGAIAMFTTSRSALISANLPLCKALASNIFASDSTGHTLSIGEAVRRTKNSLPFTDDNKLRFILMGDPAMRFPVPSLDVKTELVDGINPDTLQHPDFPVFKGGSKVKFSGTIRRGDNVARDFDGFIYLTLYDAEVVLTTKDPEADDSSSDQSQQKQYNARTNKLFEGRAKVVAGRWEAEVPLSTDIENNFSPASLTYYAYSDNGLEANGSCSSFYIYGIDDSNKDAEGPEITAMGLNSYNFKPGSHVSPNAVFFAKFHDPSGINLASSGIGHEMFVCIDNKDYFTNIRDYYEPDADNIGGGHVAYPLTDLEPGRHTLTFTVCDNLGNQNTQSIDFAVVPGSKPTIYDIYTDCNPASTSVTFTLLHDRLQENTNCQVSVFNLSGSKIWTGKISGSTNLESGSAVTWNLHDNSGRRVPRGIYLYRATVESQEGVSVSKTGKLAVTER